MRVIIAIACFCVVAGFSPRLFAQDTSGLKPAATQNPDAKSTQELVKSAHAAKATRKKSATKVITNKDVKKSKGKLIELPKSEKPVMKTTGVKTIAEQDVNYRQRREATEHLAAAQKKVDGLQKELDSIEQRYYEENDPNYRDNVIQQRFQQTKRQLQDAQHELADARDAAQKLTPVNLK
jgi:hypothetical protein